MVIIKITLVYSNKLPYIRKYIIGVDSMDYVLLGARVRRERLKRGLTQEQLAELSNITPSYIGIIERGDKKLSVETLVKLAVTLNVSTDYLLSDSLDNPADSRMTELQNIVKDIDPFDMNLTVDIVKTIAAHNTKKK